MMYDYDPREIGFESEQDSLLPSFEENWWGDHCVHYEEDTCVTSLSYDDTSEILWAGHESGRLVAYLGQNGFNAFEKFSSFKTANEPIVDICPFYSSKLFG